MAGYLAAALPPCPTPAVRSAPPSPAEGVHAAAPAHDTHAGHGAHAGHDAHTGHTAHAHHAAPQAAASAPEAPDVSVRAPCPCGCQKPGAAGTTASRLGPALPSSPLACALPRAAEPAWGTPASLPEAPPGALDPVPRLVS
jgi:hypothetical protein